MKALTGVRYWFLGATVIILVAILACGASATATPRPAATVSPTAMPVATAAPPAVKKVEKLIFSVSIPLIPTNLFWETTRGVDLQNDPYAGTLIDHDPETGAYIPRLASKWEVSPDATKWTFSLEKGVQLHFGFGEFTADDFVLTNDIQTNRVTGVSRVGTILAPWEAIFDTHEVINDYQIAFSLTQPSLLVPFWFSRSGGLVSMSKAQWDKEGVEGIRNKPASTGSYQYAGRDATSIRFERVANHWRGERPEFQQLEMRFAEEPATRLAAILAGEAHIAVAPRDLLKTAKARGMKIIGSKLPTRAIALNLGGLYLTSADPAPAADLPWLDRRVRQALNKGVNRQQILDVIYEGRAINMIVAGYHPGKPGWNPEWETRYDEMYGYDPSRARELLKEAGFGPGELKFKATLYSHPGVPELADVLQAVQIMWNDIGVQETLESVDFSRVRDDFKNKTSHGIVFATTPSFSLATEPGFRSLWYGKKGGVVFAFTNDFIDERFEAVRKLVDLPERDRRFRELGDHLFEEFASVPLFWFTTDIAVDPAVVSGWVFPGLGPTYTHWNLVKAAK